MFTRFVIGTVADAGRTGLEFHTDLGTALNF